VLHGAPTNSIQRLQRVQYSAARIVLQAPRRSHTKLLLRQLQLLPVQQRITCKLAVLAFKVSITSMSSHQNTRHAVRDSALNNELTAAFLHGLRLHKTRVGHLYATLDVASVSSTNSSHVRDHTKLPKRIDTDAKPLNSARRRTKDAPPNKISPRYTYRN